jgi:hypothetical protein
MWPLRVRIINWTPTYWFGLQPDDGKGDKNAAASTAPQSSSKDDNKRIHCLCPGLKGENLYVRLPWVDKKNCTYKYCLGLQRREIVCKTTMSHTSDTLNG